MSELSGWVKIHRKILEWPVWQAMSPGQKVVTVTMIAMANWKDEEIFDRVTLKKIIIPRGSFLSSLREIAELSDTGIQTVRTALRYLKSDPSDGHFLTQKVTQGKTLFTICKYCEYQDYDEEDNTESNTQGNTPPNTPPNKRSIYKKIKKYKNTNIPTQNSLFDEGEANKQQKKASKKNAPKKVNEAKALLDFYFDEYQTKFGVKPHISGAKEINICKQLLKTHDPDTLKTAILDYISLQDNFIADKGYPLAMISSQINGLVLNGSRTRQKSKDEHDKLNKKAEAMGFDLSIPEMSEDDIPF